jgi:peptidoglycan/xylan/chitin deacetylase (PgdA/CDA1 family)
MRAALVAAGCFAAHVAVAACAPGALGTARTLTLPREAAAWGTAQHKALPLAPREVAITFDDGPRAESTPQVLQALAAQCVKATFFMNGDALSANPELGRRVRGEGHSVGMHGFHHSHFSTLPEPAQLADLKAMQAVFRQVLGVDAPAYRFPFLEETPALVSALDAQRIAIISVDVGIDDWLPDQTPRLLADRLAERLAASGGGIILLHDAQDQTARALPLLLRTLKERGYRVVHLEWD